MQSSLICIRRLHLNLECTVQYTSNASTKEHKNACESGCEGCTMKTKLGKLESSQWMNWLSRVQLNLHATFKPGVCILNTYSEWWNLRKPHKHQDENRRWSCIFETNILRGIVDLHLNADTKSQRMTGFHWTMVQCSIDKIQCFAQTCNCTTDMSN